jgi:hypothetical protein
VTLLKTNDGFLLGGKIPPPLGIKTQSHILGKQIHEIFQTCYKEIIYKFTIFTHAEMF